MRKPNPPVRAQPPGAVPSLRRVDLQLAERSYPILIGDNSLSHLGAVLKPIVSLNDALVVTDTNVRVLYGNTAADALARSGCDCRIHEVPAGEASKSAAQVAAVYDTLAEWGGSRELLVVGVGGGVVCDLAGFVAATWLRGVPLVLVPTSLEAAIDASIGGKNAINHAAGKNLIGTFHQPRAVFIDIACFTTLPGRDLRAGLAESIKHAVIGDAAFFDWQESRAGAILSQDAAVMFELVERNCRIKAGYVEKDELDTKGIRAALNYGHTVGHAVEAELATRAGAGEDLRHGECVALGMLAANEIAVEHIGLSGEEAGRIRGLIERFGLPARLPAGSRRAGTAAAICERLRFDKKRRPRGARFVLCRRIGQVELVDDVPPDVVGRAVETLLTADC